MIDNLCNVYDLFNLEELNDLYLNRKKDDDDGKKKKSSAMNATSKSRFGPKPKKKKPLKRRNMEKVEQGWVIRHLLDFIHGNETLMHLDLTDTGLDQKGIV